MMGMRVLFRLFHRRHFLHHFGARLGMRHVRFAGEQATAVIAGPRLLGFRSAATHLSSRAAAETAERRTEEDFDDTKADREG
jgi:hypothetical protein